MLSHDSMTYAARQNMSLFNLEYAQETSVSYLPQVCLINTRADPTQLKIGVKYERDNQTYICIRPVAYSGDDDGHLQHDPSGGSLLLCGQERLEGHTAREHPTLQVNQHQQPPSWSRSDIFQLRPTRTVGVPRVWEKIEEGIKSKASSRGPKKMVVIIIAIIINLITIILIIIINLIIIVILIIALRHISTMTSTHHGDFCP